jgi:outer membrane protein TolC
VHAVATRVKVAYYDALLAEEAVRLSDNTVRRIRQTLDETRKMNEAGISTDYEVLRLEVELANVEPTLRRSRNAAASARRSLAVELGATALDSLELDGSLFDLGGVEVAADDSPLLVRVSDATGATAGRAIDTQDALDLARANRSDLRQIALMEQLRRTELRVERSEYLPKVTLFGTYSIVAQQNGSPQFFGESSEQRAYGRQVGVQVTLPVFSGFKRPALVAQREVALAQVREQAALLGDQVENQVKTLFDQVDEARTRSRAQSFALRQAQRGYEIASVQYREGIGTQLELTDAEVALRQSEFNRAEAVYDYLVARARFEEAIGMVPLPESAERVAYGMENGTR